MITKEQIAAGYQQIQDEICAALELTDGKAQFEEELWEREGGGGGRTRIIQNGSIFEKGGVNFSAVYGHLPESMKKVLNVAQDDFFATGVSIVIHPNHPMVPIIHMNIRYFEMPSTFSGGQQPVRWFGGGIDLTPHYVIEEDAQFFHGHLKAVCDSYYHDFYHRFKLWADDYFFIKHRNETRGIGGIFYDRLTANDELTWEQVFEFSKSVGRSFIPMYTELVNRNRNKPYTEAQQFWQYQRRSRYAEFNLVYDAGTRFGLETNGRIESILMSLPPTAKWVYDYKAEPGSEEEKTLSLLKKRDKLGITKSIFKSNAVINLSYTAFFIGVSFLFSRSAQMLILGFMYSFVATIHFMIMGISMAIYHFKSSLQQRDGFLASFGFIWIMILGVQIFNFYL